MEIEASYGEIWCSDSMVYYSPTLDTTVLKVTVDEDFYREHEDEIATMLKKVDAIIMEYLGNLPEVEVDLGQDQDYENGEVE